MSALSHEGNVNGRLSIRAIMGTISLPPIHGVVLGLLSDCIQDSLSVDGETFHASQANSLDLGLKSKAAT
jgi:hypothetical protein